MPINTAHLMRASALVLLLGGLALLFAPDEILPRLIADFPAGGAWIGQLIAGSWLGVAALNWLTRGSRLGGIYGRPVVLANTVLYFVSAIALLKVAVLPHPGAAVVIAAVVFAIFAALYGWLMFRGPAV
jgi:hypothetical protein